MLSVAAMRVFSRSVAAALAAACVLTSPAFSQSWKTGHGNENDYAEIASRAPGAALRIECARGVIWLRYYPGRGWNGGAQAAVRSGSYTSAMEIDGGDGALLSNLPGGDIGITGALIEAMKVSESLVIEGAAAARVPQGQRSFALPGASRVIGQLQSRCKR